jgi:fermentation-respiration switch protein FrsA (DUF1100 family)
MTRTKIVFTGLGTASFIILCILLASSFYLYHLGIERKTQSVFSKNIALAHEHEQLLSARASLEQSQSSQTEISSSGWIERQPYETWTLTSGDGLKLVGYYISARIPTTNTVILAHGYGGRGMEMGKFAQFYAERLGFNVLLPDARGHGASEGNYIGFGWPDRLDYLFWIQKVVDRVGHNAQIVLHGLSMGGSTVMMTSGESLPEQVKVIVADSGYTSVYDELAYQLKNVYNLPSFPFISAASLMTDIRAGYNFAEASSLNQVKKSKTPMLFIHGVSDTFVPTNMALELFDACNAEKELYLVQGAGHGMAYDMNRPEYEMIVSDFIELFMERPEIVY